jgi:hypothetical protein
MSMRTVGRPPKFAQPRRVVTVTLPEATLKDLEIIDPDRARAIVQATDLALSKERAASTVGLLPVAPDAGLLVMPYSRALSEIDGVTLIRILPGRYLVLLEPGVSLSEAEVAVFDRLEAAETTPGEDLSVLRALLTQLRTLRRAGRTQTRHLILVSH